MTDSATKAIFAYKTLNYLKIFILTNIFFLFKKVIIFEKLVLKIFFMFLSIIEFL
jgi:hypothetical protein